MKKIFIIISAVIIGSLLLVWGFASIRRFSPVQTEQSSNSGETPKAEESNQWYSNDDLSLRFEYPKSWGAIQPKSFGPDEFTSGTRTLLEFVRWGEEALKAMARPVIDVQTSDYAFHGPREGYSISELRFDLKDSDEKLRKALSLPSTTSLEIKRVAVSGVNGLYIEEKGKDAMSGELYDRVYYIFPEYRENPASNFSIMGDAELKPALEQLVTTLSFE